MNNQIRILHVFASLDRGGSETLIMNIYRKIDKSKYQFDFVVNDSNKKYAYEDEIISLGGRIYRIPKYKFYNMITYLRQWKKILKNSNVNVVHGHHTTPGFLYLSLAKKYSKIAIAHSHIAGKSKGIIPILKSLHRYPLRFIADYLFACSENSAQWMFGKMKNKSIILNNSIDVERFSFNKYIRKDLRSKLNLEDKFVIGNVGRLNNQKNHKFILEVFEKIIESETNSVLLLIGIGELYEYIKTLIKEKNLDNKVYLLGARSDVNELYQVFDVFLMPSIYEGLPLTLIEAQTSGLKCVVSNRITKEVDVSNNVDFVDLNHDAKYWAEIVLKYKSAYKRDGISKKTILAGYDVESNTKKLISLYNQFINEKKL